MEKFRYFKKEGDSYTLKMLSPSSIYASVVCFVVALVIVVRYVLGHLGTGWLLASLLFMALGIMVFIRLNRKIVFSPKEKIITFPSMKGSTPQVYSFDDFVGFQMTKMPDPVFRFISGHLFEMKFNGQSKVETKLVRQYGYSTKNAQLLMNEIEIVMGEQNQ